MLRARRCCRARNLAFLAQPLDQGERIEDLTGFQLTEPSIRLESYLRTSDAGGLYLSASTLEKGPAPARAQGRGSLSTMCGIQPAAWDCTTPRRTSKNSANNRESIRVKSQSQPFFDHLFPANLATVMIMTHLCNWFAAAEWV